MSGSGLLLVNKPEGPSSFDIIRSLRKGVRIKKMGHAGTLDPLASGLLVVAVGQATKLLPYLPTDTKEYHFTIQFGETRTTGDREGEVVESGFSFPDEASLKAMLPDFTGLISQIPPAYSAIKIDGKRAYELAREGKEVAMKSREVTVYSLELLSYNEETSSADLCVSCSAGTYVRTLVQDIAASLGSGAYASRIHRTKIGPFSLDSASTPEQIKGREYLLDPAPLMPEWTTVTVNGEHLTFLKNGNAVPLPSTEVPDSFIWVVDSEQIPVALCEMKTGLMAPVRVFPEW